MLARCGLTRGAGLQQASASAALSQMLSQSDSWTEGAIDLLSKGLVDATMQQAAATLNSLRLKRDYTPIQEGERGGEGPKVVSDVILRTLAFLPRVSGPVTGCTPPSVADKCLPRQADTVVETKSTEACRQCVLLVWNRNRFSPHAPPRPPTAPLCRISVAGAFDWNMSGRCEEWRGVGFNTAQVPCMAKGHATLRAVYRREVRWTLRQ